MISSKLPAVGTTIFTVMSSLAARTGAINLGQGFPDFEMPPLLIELVNEAMRDGFNQYAHTNGHPALREVIADKVQFLYGHRPDPEAEITVTPGGTYAIYTALTTVLRAGDEVIVLEPAYDSYLPGIEVNGAVPVRIPLEFPSYRIDWQRVRENISSRTRLIMINSPHNPSGSILTSADLEELERIVERHGLLVLSDEVYEHLIYDGMPHESVLRYPQLSRHSFVCFSLGKVFHCTGWKIGYCIAPPALTAEFRKVHQYNCFSVDTPKQVALANFLRDREQYLSLGGFLQEKRDYFLGQMTATPFEMLPSRGSYFILGRYGHFSQESEMDFAIRLATEYGVAAIPVSAFYREPVDNKVVRFCFAKKKETLDAATERLARIRI